MFKIPIDGLNEDSICNIPKQSQLADLIRRTRLIIWDEVTAQNHHGVEAVDKTCRDLRDNDAPFGKITVVFGGDFQQTLPIIKRASREDIVAATIQKSAIWRNVEILQLTQNMWLKNEHSSQDFAQWLLNIGHG
jgi:hypothetical protein